MYVDRDVLIAASVAAILGVVGGYFLMPTTTVTRMDPVISSIEFACEKGNYDGLKFELQKFMVICKKSQER